MDAPRPDRRLRTALALAGAGALGVAACLPPGAPGWLFWAATGTACAAAFAWAVLGPS